MAEQIELFIIRSPCQGVCQADKRGFCLGCLRSRDERFHWHEFSDAQKRNVLRLCQQRALRKGRGAKPPDAPATNEQLPLF